MRAKKFKELKVGDTIYFCDRYSRFTKQKILHNNILKVKSFTVDKIENFQEFIKFTSYTQGISIYTPKKVVKHFTTYYTYSTSKKWVEKEVTRMFNDFIDNLKKMIKDGKKAEKDLSEILNSKITI